MLSKIVEGLIVGVTLLVLGVAAAMAQELPLVAQIGEVRLVLTSRPCTEALVLAHIKPEYRGDFAEAVAMGAAGATPMCWDRTQGRDRASYFLVIDPRGTVMPVPRHMFGISM